MKQGHIIRNGDFGTETGEYVISDFAGYLNPRSKFLNGVSYHPQMQGLFDDLISSVGDSFQEGMEKAKDKLLSQGVNVVLSDPNVQQAVIKEAQESAVQNIATQIQNVIQSPGQFVSRYKWPLIGGALGLSTVVYLIARRK